MVAKLLYSVAVALNSIAHDYHRHSELNMQADWLALINHLDISTSHAKCTQMSTEKPQALTHVACTHTFPHITPL